MAFNFAAIRNGFFDQAKVVAAVDKAKRKGFSKAGAYVRQRARQSIRRKKGSAPSGGPPHAHSGQIKLIYFAWDQRTESVVVGPVLFAARRGPAQGAKLLEHGGEAQYQDGKGRPRRVRYRGNPFMRPAMMAELPKFAGLFKGSIGG
jgi:hypothetical protein